MMNINLESAVKYPFTDREWLKKSGVVMAILSVYYLLSNSMNYAVRVMEVTGTDISSTEIGTGILFFMLFAVLALALVSIPIFIYFAGYTLDTVKQVMSGDSETLPAHGQYWQRFLLGLKWMLVYLPYMLVLGLAYAAIFGLIFFGGVVSFTDGGSVAIGLVMMIVGGLLALPVLAVSLVFSFVIVHGVTYQLVRYNSMTAGWNLDQVIKISTKNWQNFSIVTLISILLSFVLTFASLIFTFCCMSWLVQGVGTVWSQLVIARLLGQAFSEIVE